MCFGLSTRRIRACGARWERKEYKEQSLLRVFFFCMVFDKIIYVNMGYWEKLHENGKKGKTAVGGFYIFNLN